MTTDQTLQIQYRSVADLIPYAKNARTHSDTQVAQIAASIREFGWTNPILLDGVNGIIAGHGRVLAARKLKLETVPCIELSWMTEAQKRAYVIADNQLALTAGWDKELLALELAGLKELAFDLPLIGFDDDELAKLLHRIDVPSDGLTDPDEVPETPEGDAVWVKAGDLFALGQHRLLCADSTNPDDVARLMNGERARLMATDPPYLVDYDGKNHPASKTNAKTKDKHWDTYHDPATSVAFFASFIRAALPHLLPHVAIYQWHATTRQALVEAAWRETGLLWHQTIIWRKLRAVLTHSHYLWSHEPCAYGWVEGKMPKLRPPASERTVWDVDQKGESDGIHPTQKPVELFAKPIQFHTNPGELLYEPFSGSGTALIAAERLGRRCYAMEKESAYVQVAITRWEQHTGNKALKLGDEHTPALAGAVGEG